MSEKKMTKMEAVGHLCQVKKDLEQDAKHLAARLADALADEGNSMTEYYEENLLTLKSQIRALEMAGSAMTR